MKFTSTIFFALVALASASPAAQPEPEAASLEARQSYGNCRISGRGDLNVHTPPFMKPVTY